MQTNFTGRKLREGQETITQQLDPKMKPFGWQNADKQTHVWVSFLHEIYPPEKFPLMKERFPRVECPVGKVTLLPHQYYKIYSRDDSPCTGVTMTFSEFLENYAPASIKHIE